MFETIRAFFRLIRLYTSGDYVLVHAQTYLTFQRQVKYLLEADAGRADVIRDLRSKLPSAEEFARVKQLAEQAYDVTVNMLPQSGIVATKAAGAVAVSGMDFNIEAK